MDSIEVLPDVVIIDMLACGVLDVIDIVNFASTCKRYYSISNANFLWRSMFTYKWPALLSKEAGFKRLPVVANALLAKSPWKVLYQHAHRIFHHLNKIYLKYFSENQLDDEVLEVFVEIADEISYEFVRTILKDIILLRHASVSLTEKYYARKAFRYLCQELLKPKFTKLLSCDSASSGDATFSPLLQGAILIEQWFNPLVQHSEAVMTQFLSDASTKVLARFETLKSTQCSADDNDLSRIEYRKYTALNEVFFEDLMFVGNQGDYFNVKNSFVHEVIKTRKGIPILLCILYREIAAKIGLHLECVNNPGHFVLRWKVEEFDSQQPTISDIARVYRFVDVFNGGRLLHYSELPKSSLRVEDATLAQVLHRISLNVDAHSRISELERDVHCSLSALNLCLIFDPSSHRVRAKRMTQNFNHDINLSLVLQDNEAIPEDIRPRFSLADKKLVEQKVKDQIQKKEKRLQNYKASVSLRSDDQNRDVLYSVGMVMHHHRYDYVCVIRGWDPRCKMSKAWVRQMGVHNLDRGVDQPFYHVLVHKDGSERYAASDSLELIGYHFELDHPEIGHYFSGTSNQPFRHYLPNSELNRRYPEDAAFTLNTISQLAAQPTEQMQ